MTTLTKTRSVLNLIGIDEAEGPTFCQLPEDGETSRSYTVSVDFDVWDDMGRPDVITVTIEPGDQLNDE